MLMKEDLTLMEEEGEHRLSSYNASTGQVTVSPPTSYVQMSGYTDYARNGSNSGGSWSVYLLVGSIKSL